MSHNTSQNRCSNLQGVDELVRYLKFGIEKQRCLRRRFNSYQRMQWSLNDVEGSTSDIPPLARCCISAPLSEQHQLSRNLHLAYFRGDCPTHLSPPAVVRSWQQRQHLRHQITYSGFLLNQLWLHRVLDDYDVSLTGIMSEKGSLFYYFSYLAGLPTPAMHLPEIVKTQSNAYEFRSLHLRNKSGAIMRRNGMYIRHLTN